MGGEEEEGFLFVFYRTPSLFLFSSLLCVDFHLSSDVNS